MFNSVHNQPRLSKRAIIDALPDRQANITKSKLPARNTLDYTDVHGVRRIRLHDTDILTFEPDGGPVTIDTGGWNTHTTRSRLNRFLPKGYYVFTAKGRIHLSHREHSTAHTPFLRTITFEPGGGFIVPDIAPDKLNEDKRAIDAYMKAWREHELPEPEPGDPWMFAQSGPKVSEEIMRDWVESKYIMFPMFKLAMNYAGVPDEGVRLHFHIAKHDEANGRCRGFNINGRVRRYIRACLGYAV